jgi:hypothetical protein
MRNLLCKSVAFRLWCLFRHYGLKAAASKVLTFARKRIYVDETHVWYELTLGPNRPRVDRLPNLSLTRVGVRDLLLLEQLPTNVDVCEARRRIEAGHDLWLSLKGRQPIFACWVFHGSLPVIASRHGHIALPSEIVAFEDSVASPAYRGRGIGLVVWPKIADRLEQSPARTIITKVEEPNVTARRAFEKAGFREVMAVHFRRKGPWRGLTMRTGDGVTASWLAEQLAR